MVSWLSGRHAGLVVGFRAAEVVGFSAAAKLVHPETDEEHVLSAAVERVVMDGDTYAGIQARFAVLPEREQRSLAEFVARELHVDEPAESDEVDVDVGFHEAGTMVE